MKRLILFCSLLLGLVLTACVAQPSEEQAANEGEKPIVTVYRAPT